jgi:hypothetical protein
VLENVILDKYCTIKPGVRLNGLAESPLAIGKKEIV